MAGMGTQGATRDVYFELLWAAAEARASLTRMKVAKLLYLIDLEAVRTTGRQETAVRWQWLDFGPFSNVLYEVEDHLIAERVATRQKGENYFGSPEYRLSLAPGAPRAPERPREIVLEIVEQFGRLSPSTLKSLTYETKPMVLVQEHGSRGDDLDLSVERPTHSLRSVRERFGPVLERLGHPADDPEGIADVESSMKELEGPRRRAADSML